MNSQAQKYGGEWTGSALNDCYELEITNSKVLNPKTDSLDYYAALIGRAFIDSLNYGFECIQFELVNEKSIGIASTSNSISATFDLNLIRKFKDKDIEEYLIIRKAYYSIRNSYRGNVSEAQSWIENLSTKQLEHPFVILAKAEILRTKGSADESLELINSISSNYPYEPQLHKYISFYYSKDNNVEKALEHGRIAYELAPSNAEFLSNMVGIYQETKQWDSVYQFTSKLIEMDSNNLNAYYTRAYAAFQIDLTDTGCNDLATIFRRDPTIVFADSMSNYCK
ncbi:MAG: hypothetical protein AAGA66_04830 [Bacteroidota bacterium]